MTQAVTRRPWGRLGLTAAKSWAGLPQARPELCIPECLAEPLQVLGLTPLGKLQLHRGRAHVCGMQPGERKCAESSTPSLLRNSVPQSLQNRPEQGTSVTQRVTLKLTPEFAMWD